MRFQIFSCMLLFITSLSISHTQFVSSVLNSQSRNPNRFEYNGKRYYINSLFKTNFFKALQFCRQQQMQLLSFNSEDEHNWMSKYLMKNGFASNYFWTSGTNLGGDSEWMWLSTGHKITFNKWYHGEPSGRSRFNESENCLEFRHIPVDIDTYVWNDLPCNRNILFICESIGECQIEGTIKK